jgi:hypothetical protein
MKLIHTILILIIIYIICCARTCTEEDNSALMDEKEAISELQDSIKHIFGTSIPDNDQLRSFEAAAKQKLINFSEYLKIASDSSMDAGLRKQAAEMAERLFISVEADTRKWSNAIQDSDLSTLNQLIEASLLKGMPCWIQPEQISVMEPFLQKDDSTFSGTLSYIQDCIPFSIIDNPGNVPDRCVIDIYVIRKPKTFGIEVLRVWEIYLGDIRNQKL